VVKLYSRVVKLVEERLVIILKLMDKVWIFNNNKREYVNPETGEKLGIPWYKGHFIPLFVIGETTRSWILGSQSIMDKVVSGEEYSVGSCYKVTKKDPKMHGYHAIDSRIYFSEEEVNQECWMYKNKYKVTDLLLAVGDYNTFKKVADMLGLEEC